MVERRTRYCPPSRNCDSCGQGTFCLTGLSRWLVLLGSHKRRFDNVGRSRRIGGARPSAPPEITHGIPAFAEGPARPWSIGDRPRPAHSFSPECRQTRGRFLCSHGGGRTASMKGVHHADLPPIRVHRLQLPARPRRGLGAAPRGRITAPYCSVSGLKLRTAARPDWRVATSCESKL